MNSGIITIGIFIVIISVLIYFIKNWKEILEFFGKKKLTNYVSKIIIVVVLLVSVFYLYKKTINIKANLELYKLSKENDKMFAKYDEMILNENEFYRNSLIKEYPNQKPKEPYIPEGFKYVEGEWDTGYVIQDEEENQYVWVPCTNKEKSEIGILQRVNSIEQSFISKDLCTNEEYKEFITSALENGGFYISRYEIGKENESPVSKSGKEIWTGVTRNEALNIIDKMYENINCELINGYAYDTTLLWIMEDNKIKSDIVDMNNFDKIFTGRNSYNNIYDFVDNVMEITYETNYSNVIIRGFFGEENSVVSLIDLEYKVNDLDRFSIREQDNYFTITTLLGFRTVIYK